MDKENSIEDKTVEENSSQYMETEPIPDIDECVHITPGQAHGIE